MVEGSMAMTLRYTGSSLRISRSPNAVNGVDSAKTATRPFN
jgi:hypothetical protein